MADNILQNGVRKRLASLPQRKASENGCAVLLEGGSMPWHLQFWAAFGSQKAYLGGIRAFALVESRLVAFIACPGADYFEVEGQGADVSTNDRVMVSFQGADLRGGPWGVSAVPGTSVLGSRSYRVVTGAAGVVVVTGEVFGWAARATAPGATVAVAATPALSWGPVGVPANGEVHGDARGILAPVSTWTFVGTTGYLIEFAPPGGVFDG